MLTSKPSNVLLHPLASQPLVTKTKVRVATVLNLLSVQEAPCTEAVVDGDTDERLPNHITVLNPKGHVVALIHARTHVKTAFIDHPRRPDDVEVETVFRHGVVELVRLDNSQQQQLFQEIPSNDGLARPAPLTSSLIVPRVYVHGCTRLHRGKCLLPQSFAILSSLGPKNQAPGYNPKPRRIVGMVDVIRLLLFVNN